MILVGKSCVNNHRALYDGLLNCTLQFCKGSVLIAVTLGIEISKLDNLQGTVAKKDEVQTLADLLKSENALRREEAAESLRTISETLTLDKIVSNYG